VDGEKDKNFARDRGATIVEQRRSTHYMRIRAFILVLLFLATLGLAGCGQGAIFMGSNWAVVNNASEGGGISNLTIAATGKGNLIVVGLMFNAGTYVTGVTDDAGNSYASAGAKAYVGDGSTEIWYAVNSKPGATVVTPAFANATTHVEITVWEVSGIATSAPDAANGATGSVTAGNTPGPSVTTTQAGDFVVSILFAVDASVSGISSGNAFTNDFTTNGNGWAHITSNSAAKGTYQASWSTTPAQGIYCASTVAFRSAI
jgi:hypothetical protein